MPYAKPRRLKPALALMAGLPFLSACAFFGSPLNTEPILFHLTSHSIAVELHTVCKGAGLAHCDAIASCVLEKSVDNYENTYRWRSGEAYRQGIIDVIARYVDLHPGALSYEGLKVHVQEVAETGRHIPENSLPRKAPSEQAYRLGVRREASQLHEAMTYCRSVAPTYPVDKSFLERREMFPPPGNASSSNEPGNKQLRD